MDYTRLDDVTATNTNRPSRSRTVDLLLIAGLCVVYYATAKLGFRLAVPPGNVTAVWLPSGIALAAVLTFGYRLWPGIWIGSLVLNASFLFNSIQVLDPARSGAAAYSLIVGSVIASGSTLEILLAAYLLHRLTGDKTICQSGKGVIAFAVCSGALCCLVGSTIGVGSLLFGGFLEWSSVGMTWLTWWLGDTTGVLLVTPLLMTLRMSSSFPWSTRKIVEVAVLFTLVFVIGFLLFGSAPLATGGRLALAYLVIPVLIWPAFRFTQRETAIAMFSVSAIAYWGTVNGHAPFGSGDVSQGILLFQGFVGVAAVTTLTLSADIAHRRRVEQSLYRYKTASLQTADHWMLTDLDGTIRDVNPSFEKVTGYSAEEVMGKRPDVLKSGEHDESFFKDMWSTVLSGRVYRGVVVNRRKNGELFYELKTITPIRDDFGRVTQLLSLGKDITEVKETRSELQATTESLERAYEQLLASESALLRQNRILESVLNSMKEGVVVANDKGQFVLFNRSAEQMVGIGFTDSSPGEWTTRYGVYSSESRDVFPAEDLPLVRALNGEETDNVEMFIHNPEKTEGTWLSVNGRPLREESGDGIGGLVVLRDITEGKRVEVAERELKANRAELAVAKKIQKKLFPDAAPQIDGYDIAGATYPAVETGGDYFDYLVMPDGRLVALIGDVSGHGFGPALLMASTRAYLHALLLSNIEVPETLEIANRLISNDTAPEDFVTLILTKIDPRTRTLEYASAGHTTCHILDSNHNIKSTLDSTGTPLGVVPEANFGGASKFDLERGDTIVLMTDGVLEAECAGGEPFGERRALDTVRSNGDKSAAEIVKSIRDELLAQRQGTQDDDVTVVVVKVL
jgi:PAS domain S-box-containing protein